MQRNKPPSNYWRRLALCINSLHIKEITKPWRNYIPASLILKTFATITKSGSDSNDCDSLDVENR